jgi:hypothetical protein
MKKEHAHKSKSKTAERLQREYRFDYSKAKPNRFASQVQIPYLLD